jgi:hypothetical protein
LNTKAATSSKQIIEVGQRGLGRRPSDAVGEKTAKGTRHTSDGRRLHHANDIGRVLVTDAAGFGTLDAVVDLVSLCDEQRRDSRDVDSRRA